MDNVSRRTSDVLKETFSGLVKYRAPLLFFVCAFFCFFLIAEGIASYVLFRRAFNDSSAVSHVLNEFADLVRKRLRTGGGAPNQQRIIQDTSWENPFQTLYADRLMTDDIYRIHPFIGYSNVSTHLEFRPRMDYFGFRNMTDQYFAKPVSGTKLVVITGGSEAAGHTHNSTIAERLEKYLNRYSRTPYQVLNLAMCGYAIAHEISAYTHLAYHLKPEYVISHTAWNDAVNASMIPENFKRLGLNYIKFEEYWLPRFYELKAGPRFSEYVQNDRGEEFITPAFFDNAEKYKRIVTTNSGKFILGIQDNDPSHFPEVYKPFYDKVETRYLDIREKARKKGYIVMADWGPYQFKDDIHTDDNSAQRIAEVYGQVILKQGGGSGINK